MSSESDEYGTPQEFFDNLDARFHFTLDAAASDINAKCERYYTKKDNGLLRPWIGTVWCNPPYSRGIEEFTRKAFESAWLAATIVMLIPSSTDTAWWHDHIMYADIIYLIRGRLSFVRPNGTSPGPARFSSAVAVFNLKQTHWEYDLSWEHDHHAPWRHVFGNEHVAMPLVLPMTKEGRVDV